MTAATESNVEVPSVVSRVYAYPAVSKTVDTTMSYYQYVKDYNQYLKGTIESVESQVSKGYETISPSIASYLQSEQAKSTLAKIDSFGNQQLDSLEATSGKLAAKVQSTRSSATNMITALPDEMYRRVAPLDDYLRSSPLGTPLNVALDVTENVADRFLPQLENPKAADGSSEGEAHPGPFVRAGRLSHRGALAIQQVPARVQHDTSASLQKCAKLVTRATQELDKGIHNTNQLVNNTWTAAVAKSQTSLTYLKDRQQQLLENDRVKLVSEQIVHARVRAISLLNSALDTLQNSPATHNLMDRYKRMRDNEHITKLLAAFDRQKFLNIAHNSISELNKIAASLLTAIKSPNNATLLKSVRTQLLQVLHTLFGNIVSSEETESPAASEEGDESKTIDAETPGVADAQIASNQETERSEETVAKTEKKKKKSKSKH